MNTSRQFFSTILLAIAPVVACGSSTPSSSSNDAGTGTSADGGRKQSGSGAGAGGGGLYDKCQTSGGTTGADVCGTCVQDKCATPLAACFGTGASSGNFSGPCADYMNCSTACACNDTACSDGCSGKLTTNNNSNSAATSNCQRCILNVADCESSKCATECGSSSHSGATPTLDGGGISALDATLSTHTCADLTRCCANLTAPESGLTNAQGNCTTALAAKVDFLCGEFYDTYVSIKYCAP